MRAADDDYAALVRAAASLAHDQPAPAGWKANTTDTQAQAAAVHGPTLSDLPDFVLTLGRQVQSWAVEHPLYTVGIGLGLILLAGSRRRGR